MKRIATLTAAIAIASATTFAHAAGTGTYRSQVSQDDFSATTSPRHAPAGSMQGYEPQASDMTEQGLTGPRAGMQAGHRAHSGTSHPQMNHVSTGYQTSAVTREQVVQEREQARAAGQLEPGAPYMNNLAAPNDTTWSRDSRSMGGQ